MNLSVNREKLAWQQGRDFRNNEKKQFVAASSLWFEVKFQPWTGGQVAWKDKYWVERLYAARLLNNLLNSVHL